LDFECRWRRQSSRWLLCFGLLEMHLMQARHHGAGQGSERGRRHCELRCTVATIGNAFSAIARGSALQMGLPSCDQAQELSIALVLADDATTAKARWPWTSRCCQLSEHRLVRAFAE
jgi:hypothetical protein